LRDASAESAFESHARGEFHTPDSAVSEYAEREIDGELTGVLAGLKRSVTGLQRLSLVSHSRLKGLGGGPGGTIYLLARDDPDLAAEPCAGVDDLKRVSILADSIRAGVSLGIYVQNRVSVPVVGDALPAQMVTAAVGKA